MDSPPRRTALTRRKFLQLGAGSAALLGSLAVLGSHNRSGAVQARGQVVSGIGLPEPSGLGPSSGQPSAERAFGSLIAQCAFGPRNPGSAGHQECRSYLVAELAKTADWVETQDFTINAAGADLRLTNVLARHNPEQAERILLCAHWDTRPFADQDPRAEYREQPIIGANDGASGVAALIEISRVLRERQIAQGVDIVLFDGEDFGRDTQNMFLGSRYFAKSPLATPANRPFGILLDMVGDADLRIAREGFSQQYAGPALNRFWAAAQELGYESTFPNRAGQHISDDHLFLNEAGIPTIDVIDFEYPYWHTIDDTVDKCSGRSLQIVSEVVLQTLDSYWAELSV